MEERSFSLGYNNGWRHKFDPYAYQWLTYTYTIYQQGLIFNIVEYL